MSKLSNSGLRSSFNNETHGIKGIMGFATGKLMGRVVTNMSAAFESFSAFAKGMVPDGLRNAAAYVQAKIVQAARLGTRPHASADLGDQIPRMRGPIPSGP